ncbi:peptidoglycan DD-metalloendopeptidase family protein [candidate division KSB1 bacterium]|nr:peptidoglycan DD-metalloendopeptidase family protein [candidate division KSB1 bacterium]
MQKHKNLYHRYLFFISFICILLCVFSNCHQSKNPHPETNVEQQTLAPVQEIPEPELSRDESRIRYGETLSSILRKNGIEHSINYAISQELKKIYDLRKLKPRQDYIIERDSTDSIVRFTLVPSIEERYTVEYANGETSASVDKVKLQKRIRHLKGHIETSLYDAILAAGETPELLVEFTDIFQWDVDFFIDPRVGDEFKIIFEAYYLPDDTTESETSQHARFVRYGRIFAAQYTLQGEDLTAIYFNNDPHDDGYYTVTGESFQKTFLKSPLNYRRISSYFSYARKHPILKKVRAHTGIDYAAPIGTPVSAAANGTIIKMGYGREIGRYVKIRHKNPRYVTLYGHLSRYGEGMYEGKSVKQRDVIGYVGKTGLATGPHLHYTFYDNGHPINPLKIKNTSGDPISDVNMSLFSQTRDAMLAQLRQLDIGPTPLFVNPSLSVRYNRYSRLEP